MRRILSFVLVVFILLAALLLALFPRQVTGLVQDESGPPVSHAVVLLGDRIIYPGQAGYFSLGWVMGTSTVTVEADGYLPRQAMVPRGQWPGQSTLLPIVLTPNTLRGTVRDLETGVPMAGGIVTAGEESLSADEQGRYLLNRVRIGTLLSASAPGYETQEALFNGQEAHDFALQPTQTAILVLDKYSHQPVADASVAYDSVQWTTDANGMTVIKRLLPESHLLVQATGYEPTEHVYNDSASIAIALRPNTLRGVVRESRGGTPLAGVSVKLVSAQEIITTTITGEDGHYSFAGIPAAVTLTVTLPDHEPFEEPVGPVTEMDVALKRFEVRGIYMPLGLLTSQRRVLELIDLVDDTELNAIVVDMKNDRGWLAWPSAVPQAKAARAYQREVMDVRRFLALCQEKDVYTIARLVLFKDPALVAAYPEWAVHSADDQLYVDTEGSTWLDPYRAEVQDYLVAVAKEVAGLGFDELQFDYIRFPSDGPARQAKYSQESTRESRCTAIREFCARLRRELEPYGVFISADLFGLTVWVDPENDMGIGQRVIDIAPFVDYLSPMLYPSTFISGNLGLDNPMLYPYEVVYRSCIELSKRTTTRVRPWLQHYSWKEIEYGSKELRLEKQAADDAGTYGWMFWHAGGRYNATVFDAATGPP